jgi:cyclase
MKKFRIIPILTVIDNKLVKTQNFKKPIYLGDPLNAIRVFNDKEVDELVLLDIRSTLNRTPIQYELIKQVAEECFMPLAYGGGIKNLDEIRKVFSLGVEKVILSSVVLEKGFEIITQSANAYGSQSVVVCIDVKRNIFGTLICTSNGNTIKHKIDLLKYVKDLESAGVGEIIINNIDREGTFEGIDLDLTELFAKTSSVPLVTVGGLNSLSTINEIALKSNCTAVGAGSLFSFTNNNKKSILINYPTNYKL